MTAKARIYQPDKTAMQSGKGKTRRWKLELLPATPYFSDNLMGWNGMRDTNRQVELYFPTQEAAIAYAEAQGIAYELHTPHKRSILKKSYAENFAFDRPRDEPGH